MKHFTLPCAVGILAAVTILSVSEDDIRKMKIKELKEFMDERDVDYSGCVEKSDLIKTAIKMKEKKVSAEKQQMKGYTGEYPKKKFWDFWSGESVLIESASQLSDKGKKVMLDVVETCFMQHGKSVATKLKKNPDDLLKTSLKSPYYQAGMKGLTKLVHQYASKSDMKHGDVREACEKIFIPWITNVGIENTNPMYEIISPKKTEL